MGPQPMNFLGNRNYLFFSNTPSSQVRSMILRPQSSRLENGNVNNTCLKGVLEGRGIYGSTWHLVGRGWLLAFLLCLGCSLSPQRQVHESLVPMGLLEAWGESGLLSAVHPSHGMRSPRSRLLACDLEREWSEVSENVPRLKEMTCWSHGPPVALCGTVLGCRWA